MAKRPSLLEDGKFCDQQRCLAASRTSANIDRTDTLQNGTPLCVTLKLKRGYHSVYFGVSDCRELRSQLKLLMLRGL